jgi:predicted phage terminase large subunit-like protein
LANERTISKLLLEQYKQKLQLAREAGEGINLNETPTERTERIEACKKDYKQMVAYYFPHYAKAETPDFHIKFANKVRKEPKIKAFAEWGRGLAKSVVCDITVPFWLWLNGEPLYLVIIGRNEDRAKELLMDLQVEFEANPKILADFGEQKIYGSWEDGNFKTKSGFIGKALGMGQSVRGLRVKDQRPTLCVCDDLEEKDLVKNPKRQHEIAEWIERAVLPTMDGAYERLLYANNRFAPHMVQTILQDKHPKWYVHRVNAYDPVTYEPTWKEKYDSDFYRDKVEGDNGIGTLAGMAEYNNTPHVEGKIFTDEQIQWAKLPRIDHFKFIIGHWDVAYAGNTKSDYNAVSLCGVKDKDFYYIDGYCKQSKMKQAVEWMAEAQKNLAGKAIIHWQFESQFWNDEVERIIQEVEKEQGVELGLMKIKTAKTNKYDRILTLQPYFQNGRIYFNENKKGHNDTLVAISQLKGIEPGYKTHDDAPDALQQNIEKLSEQVRISNYAPPRMGTRTFKNRY